MTNQTQRFYESNAHNLMERYDSADMSALHQLLAKHIPPNGKVIDIGFGSGRDLAFLLSQGHDVYGIDPVEAFVEQAQHRFPSIREHFKLESFLSIEFPSDWMNSFDAVISVAVWMHLKASEHQRAISMIKSLLKQGGILVLSFSFGGREKNDERHFEPLELNDVVETFKGRGFSLIESQCTHDSLGRESIMWATIVLQSSN